MTFRLQSIQLQDCSFHLLAANGLETRNPVLVSIFHRYMIYDFPHLSLDYGHVSFDAEARLNII